RFAGQDALLLADNRDRPGVGVRSAAPVTLGGETGYRKRVVSLTKRFPLGFHLGAAVWHLPERFQNMFVELVTEAIHRRRPFASCFDLFPLASVSTCGSHM